MVTISRSVPLTQEQTFLSGLAAYASEIEGSFDKLTMAAQGLQEGLDRAVKVPEGSALTPDELAASFVASEASAAASAAQAAAHALVLGGATYLRADILADLRANSDVNKVVAFVRGHSDLLDLGGGTFYRDSSDTSSADDNAMVIVDAAGQRWKRQFVGALSPAWFGLASNPEGALTAAIAYALAQKGSSTVFNTSLNSGFACIDLDGREIEITSPIVMPSSGGNGGLIIRSGTLRAGASFDVNRYLVEVADSAWTTNIQFHSVFFDANRRGGCISAAWAHNWLITGCRFQGFTSHGVVFIAPGSSNRISDSFFYEYHYGQQGFNTPALHQGTAIRCQTSDVMVSGCHIGYGLNGIETVATGTDVSSCHFYGLTGWALDDSDGYNTYGAMRMDAPCKVRFRGNAPGFRTRYQGLFSWDEAANGAMIVLEPTASVELAGFTLTDSAFLSSSYTVPATAALTLSSASKGAGVTVTSSENWFDASMVGATVKSATQGALRITDYASATQVTARVVEPFASTTVAAGDWSQLVTAIFADERTASFGNQPSQLHIERNFFTNLSVQPTSSRPSVKRYIDNQESFEIEFGALLPVSGLWAGIITQFEGDTTQFNGMKSLYATTTVLGVDFETAQTGYVYAEGLLSRTEM